MFHFHASIGTRSRDSSAKTAAQYAVRAGSYRDSRNECFVEAITGHMPSWAICGSERDERGAVNYWQEADEYERANGVLYRGFEAALPDCMTVAERRDLIVDFAETVCKVPGGHLPYTIGLHARRGEFGELTHHHAHMLLSERINDDIHRGPEHWFKRAANSGQNAEEGGARKAQIQEAGKPWLMNVRKLFADTANRHLRRHGYSLRLDHRSFKSQGIDRIPTKHVGWRRDAAYRRAENLRIREFNLQSEVARRGIDGGVFDGDLPSSAKESFAELAAPQRVSDSEFVAPETRGLVVDPAAEFEAGSGSANDKQTQSRLACASHAGVTVADLGELAEFLTATPSDVPGLTAWRHLDFKLVDIDLGDIRQFDSLSDHVLYKKMPFNELQFLEVRDSIRLWKDAAFSRESVLAAMRVAVARWGGFGLNGGQDFQYFSIEIASEIGILEVIDLDSLSSESLRYANGLLSMFLGETRERPMGIP